MRARVDLEVSTLADWVGAAVETLTPLVEAIRDHVFAAERLLRVATLAPVISLRIYCGGRGAIRS